MARPPKIWSWTTKRLISVVVAGLALLPTMASAAEPVSEVQKQIFDAVKTKDIDKIERLLSSKNVSLDFLQLDHDLGRTSPLLCAIHNNPRNPYVAKALLKLGASPNYADLRGITPLLLAERWAATSTIEELKARGAIETKASEQIRKAQETFLDASVLACFVELYLAQGGDSAAPITVSDLREGTRGMGLPVMKADGNDSFGNPFLLRPTLGQRLTLTVLSEVNPKTIKGATEISDPAFWLPYMSFGVMKEQF